MLRISYIIVIIFSFFPEFVWTQQGESERYLEIRGISEFDMEPLSRATINLYEGSNLIKTVNSGSDGTFSFKLDMNKQYTIEVTREGFISKRIVFNTRMPDEEKGTWMNEFSIGLFKSCSGVNYDILKQPVDQVSFDARRREFISDKDYVNNMRPKMEALMIKSDECQLDAFEDLIKKGDQTASAGNLKEAVNIYKQALELYPREVYPTKRINEINTQLNKQQSSADAYQKLIKDADALLVQGNLAEAAQKFKQASQLNPQESYPKQKATEIQTKLDQQQSERQALLNKEDRYNQAMAKASVAYTRKDYAAAKQYYKEALEIKPQESLPKSRVQEIETIETQKAAEQAAKLAETEKKQSLEKEYLGLVQQADALFKSKKYEEAKVIYAQAFEMKPSESYPAQRVKVIENAVAAEQAAIIKTKENGYADAMASGNNALARNLFEEARGFFQKALTIKPEDMAAKSRLTEVDRAAQVFANQKSLEEQYSNHIKTGDGLMAQKNWNAAKESFSRALALKPGDKYAGTKITAIDNTVAAEQAATLKVKNESYNDALSSGNTALSKNQFEIAREFYQKALTFKPEDQTAKSRIAEANRLEADFGKQKSQQEAYAKIISVADGQFASKELTEARKSYVSALSVKPGDSYAETRITAIDRTIAAENAARLKATEDGYKGAIGAAQTAIAQKTYNQAKEYLQKALSVKPGDAYATGKIAEVERLIEDQQKKMEQEKLAEQARLKEQAEAKARLEAELANQKTRNEAYAKAITAADGQFASKKLSEARESYVSALSIKPGDSYAESRITAIDHTIAAENAARVKATEETYKAALGAAQTAITQKTYGQAKEHLQKALSVKPGDAFATGKMAEVDRLIADQQRKIEQEKLAEQAKQKKYDETVNNANQQFLQKNWQSAKTSYEQALILKPGETYPRQRLDETIKIIGEQEKAIAEQKTRDNAYSIALVNAENYFKSKDYGQAKEEYSRALTIKPSEVLPKTRITEIDNLLATKAKEQAETKARVDSYTAAINSGNAAFAKKEYPNAKTAYVEALKYMPGDLLASDQIKKIDYLVAEAEKVRKTEEARKAAYESLIATANQSFDAARYPAAKEDYKKALVIDPSSTYAKQRIARIDEIIRLLGQTPAKTSATAVPAASQKTAAIPMKELSFKNESERQLYLTELKSKYPEGITLEKYKEKYKETLRYIIIRDNQAQEFRQVRFLTYSGSEFSVNGKPITQQYFVSQTKTRQGESFKEIDMQ